ncbi:MAG: protein-tyrosine-phosphatase [Bacteroidota bacterium]
MYLKISLLFLVFAAFICAFKTTPPELYKKLLTYCNTLPDEFDQISAERQEVLKQLADHIVTAKSANDKASLTVICSHNSRRSHMGQLLLAAAAHYYGIDNIYTFSGGTEATAFNPRAIAALERAGFKFEKSANKDKNPSYKAKIGANLSEHLMYSKKYDDVMNPKEEFIAVLVCSEADEACPVVKGATARVAIPFEDPRHFDNTPSEQKQYDMRCRQIARELFFVMANVKQTIAENKK